MDYKTLLSKKEKELGLEKCKLVWSEEIVKKMSHNTDKVDFFSALQKAIHSFVTDGKKSDSFYGLIQEIPESYGLSNPVKDSDIQNVIRKNLNTVATKITLVTSETQFQPEEGESPLENWIFLVQNTQMTSGLNWAIVNRQSGKVYNYGFN